MSHTNVAFCQNPPQKHLLDEEPNHIQVADTTSAPKNVAVTNALATSFIVDAIEG